MAKAERRKARSRQAEEDVVILDDDDDEEEEEDGVETILKDVDLHNPSIPGAEHVKPVQGFFCQLCKKFFAPGKEVRGRLFMLVLVTNSWCEC